METDRWQQALEGQGPALERLARVLVSDEALARDLVQETYVAALTARPSVRGGLGAWLSATLRNRARDLRRRAWLRRSSGLDCVQGERAAEAAQETAARLEAERLVHAALRELDDPWRTALVLRFHEALTVRQIAEQLGLPASTVRSRIERGIELMRASLGRAGGAERGDWVTAIAPLTAATAIKDGPGPGWFVAAAVAGAAGVAATLLAGWGAAPDRPEGDASTASAPRSSATPPTPIGPHLVVVDPSGDPVPGVEIGFTGDRPPLAPGHHGPPVGPLVTDAWGRCAIVDDAGEILERTAFAMVPAAGDPGLDLGETRERSRWWDLRPRNELRVPATRPLVVDVVDHLGRPWGRRMRVWVKNRAERARPGIRIVTGPEARFEHVACGVPLVIEVDFTGPWQPEIRSIPELTRGSSVHRVRVRVDRRRLVVRGRMVNERGEAVDMTTHGWPRGSIDSADRGQREAPGAFFMVVPGELRTLAGTTLVESFSGPSGHRSFEARIRIPDPIPDVDLEVGDIVLRELPVLAAGVVLAPSGEPIPWCKLQVVGRDRGGAWAPTGVTFLSNGDGEFLLTERPELEGLELALDLEEPRTYRRFRDLELPSPVPIQRGDRAMTLSPVPPGFRTATRDSGLLRTGGNR